MTGFFAPGVQVDISQPEGDRIDLALTVAEQG
jgi:hypothetical protein